MKVFAAALRDTVAVASANGLDPRITQLLAGAWKRLQRSGVLVARHLLTAAEGILINDVDEASVDAIFKSMTASGLRSCALASCGAKEAHPSHFKSCAACKAVVYCCKEHQTEHWPSHKAACKAARKAQAERLC